MDALCWRCLIQALVLLLAANGAPLLINKLLGDRLNYPLDGGVKLRDGYRFFGDAKTWRGLCSAVFFTTGVAIFFGMAMLTGVAFGILAMAGDLLASFVKRRLGQAESSRARGLDTAPESLLPIVVLKDPLALAMPEIVMTAGIFFLLEEFVSPILFRLNIRNRPY
ncbi:MAG: CDP-archaeol synthase [Methylococcaceae bacterium]